MQKQIIHFNTKANEGWADSNELMCRWELGGMS